MSKYIIANCPMYFHTNCYGHTGNCDCQDCTDCLLKQIVEKCKRHADNSSYCGYCSIENLGYSVIDLLQIEEVE